MNAQTDKPRLQTADRFAPPTAPLDCVGFSQTRTGRRLWRAKQRRLAPLGIVKFDPTNRFYEEN